MMQFSHDGLPSSLVALTKLPLANTDAAMPHIIHICNELSYPSSL